MAPVIDALIYQWIYNALLLYKYRCRLNDSSFLGHIFNKSTSTIISKKQSETKVTSVLLKLNQEIHYLKSFKSISVTLRNNFSCKMMSWQIISLVILLVVLLIKGNPLEVSEKESEKIKNQKNISKLIRRIEDKYLCNYYAYPSYDQNDFLSPLSSSDYLFSLRIIRQRCRYFVEPSQKYSVWDLVRQNYIECIQCLESGK